MSKIRKIVLGYYMLMPYLALTAVAVSNTKGSGWLFLTGWLCLIVYQIILVAINQSEAKANSVVYKTSTALVVPLVVLANQIIFKGNVWLFFVEQMLLELVVVLAGLIIAIIFLSKDDRSLILPSTALLIFFTGGTFYGLSTTWLELTSGRSWIGFIPLLIGFILAIKTNYHFFANIDNNKIKLKDYDYSEYEIIAVVCQIILWLVLPTIIFYTQKVF